MWIAFSGCTLYCIKMRALLLLSVLLSLLYTALGQTAPVSVCVCVTGILLGLYFLVCYFKQGRYSISFLSLPRPLILRTTGSPLDAQMAVISRTAPTLLVSRPTKMTPPTWTSIWKALQMAGLQLESLKLRTWYKNIPPLPTYIFAPLTA